jgi:thioredoxin-dependent peroxiredoxin
MRWRFRLAISLPIFEAETTEGRIRFHEWLGNSWAVLFSHPKDFTPVCTTELGYMAKLKPEFDKRNTKIIGLSVDPVDNHKRWSNDIKETQGHAPNYPMIGDTDLKVSKAWGMLPANLEGSCDGRTAPDNQTVRNVFVVGPDKKIKLIIVYPMTTGRNFDEVLRVIDSLQLTAKHKVATPVNWKQGDDVIIAGSVSDEDAKTTYPQGWKAPRPYIRIVPQPDRKERWSDGIMAISCQVDLDTLKLRAEIQSIYARVAEDPSGEFHFHRGPEYAARRLNYDTAELSKLPLMVTESFAGVGNPHAVAPLPTGATVVDIGSGAGTDLLLAAFHVGQHGRAIGVDMTAAMRDRARRGATACGLAHVDVREGEATALPIDTESVDVVISNGVLNLVPEKRAAVAEIRRVLKPGGRVQIADIVLGVELPEDARQDIDLWTG